MKNVTLSLLFAFFVFFAVSAQADRGKKHSSVIRKVLSQNQPALRSTIADFFGSKPDSMIIRDQSGQIWERYIFKFEDKKEIEEEYEWDEELNTWAWAEKYEYYYDENKNDTMIISYDKENGTWIPNFKTVKKFTGPEMQTYEYNYNYNDAGQWELSSSYKVETTVTQDASQKKITQISTKYNEFTSTWENYFRNDYVYDAMGRELSNGYSIPDRTNPSVWVPMSRESSTYGTDGKRATYYDENWNDETQAWYPDEEKFIFSYDNEGKLAKMDAYEVSEETGTWDMTAWTYQEIFYYDGFPAGINSISVADATIWSSGKTIGVKASSGLSTIKVYGITGNLLYAQDLAGVQEFTHEMQLNQGVYIVHVKMANGQTKVSKVILTPVR